MANKYYYKSGSNYIDFANVLEPTIGTKAAWCNSFVGESFNTAGSNTSNLTISNYKVDATSIVGVKKGYLPTKQTTIATITSPGDCYIKRTDSAIIITLPDGSTTSVAKSKFPRGEVPHEILVMMVGAGGGGGGSGYYEHSKDEYYMVPGGAGGGGAIVVFRWTLANNTSYQFFISPAGGKGSNGSNSSGESTNGTAGSAGGWGTFYTAAGEAAVTVYGGRGGGAGSGTGNTTGKGGAAGYVNNYKIANDKITICAGGKGNCNGDFNSSGSASCSWDPCPGTGIGSLSFNTAKNNNGSSYNKTDFYSPYYSGGCSAGLGDRCTSATSVSAAAANGGGGGSAGSKVRNGANGKIIFYY